MQYTPLALGLLCTAVACATSRDPAALTPTSATAARTAGTAGTTAPPIDDATRDAFFAALKRGDDDAVLSALASTPALAAARSARGHSAFLVALTRISGNGFIRPQENRALAAILSRSPPLDGFEAAAAGDVARVEAEAAKDRAYVKQVHALGWTPLHFAAFGGQPAVVEALLMRGAEIDAPATNRFGNSPLQVGLLTRQPEVTRVLVAHHANVRFAQSEGVTALHEAAQGGDLESARILLDAGADPASRTGKLDDGSSGKTPLDLARAAGHTDIAALLVARGATG